MSINPLDSNNLYIYLLECEQDCIINMFRGKDLMNLKIIKFIIKTLYM